jgi:hypothetical protein
MGGSGALDGAEFGDGDLEVGEGLEEEGLEGFIRAVELVDQQGRARRPGCGRIASRSGRASIR